MNLVYLLTGSNLGNRVENLNKATELITLRAGNLVACSKFYQTSPWGPLEQPDFLNQAVAVDAFLEPQQLMERLLGIEEEMGRIRSEKYGPRNIDIDILFYGNKVMKTSLLQLPHPEVQNRRFALTPLAEIASAFIDPVSGKSISKLLSDCQDQGTVLQFN